jgi:hypothetical protein
MHAVGSLVVKLEEGFMIKLSSAAICVTGLQRRRHTIAVAGFLAATFVGFEVPARASNLVTNGSFELTTVASPGAQPTFGTGSGCTGGSLEDWCEGDGGTAATPANNGSSALALLYYPGDQADSLTDTFGTNNFSLWQGITNTIPNSSPDGGNYFVVDGGSGNNLSIYQNITGLTVGGTYELTFYQAAGQQNGFTGATTEQWQVTFGTGTGSTLDSVLQSDASHDFVPWSKQTMYFKASATSQVLTFLALGTPVGDPPMVFLDGVNMVQITPEPSTFSIGGIGICALLIIRRLRKAPEPSEAN